ncbi:MAG TPA: DMT family transporter, partial [Bradyrhizobium sp.]|nr:DMT family transporter [Bradyrhizobium sp.]
AAVAWSTAPFFTRLLPFDPWTILFYRGLFGGGFILLFLALKEGRTALGNLLSMGNGIWLVAFLSTLGMVSFIPALQETAVTNVAVIIATQPFVAAAFAWAWFREAVRPGTLLASLVAFVGVGIIVSAATANSDFSGIGLACLMVLAISAMTVAIRRYKHISMVGAAALSNFLGSLISMAFARDIAHVTSGDITILAMFGFFQVALGLTFFALGSRLLPSGQASLVATLETPLMPFWVWLAFDEIPTSRALAGGALVMAAVIADIIDDSRPRGKG